MRLARWLPLALLAALLPITPARSTTVERLELVDLIARAERVALGDCVSSQAEWDESHTRIYTRVRFAPRETLKGPSVPLLELKLPGGELGGYAYVIHGMPRFTVGQEAIVLVTAPHPVSGLVAPVGLAQGVFTIDRRGGRAVARRDTRELNLVDPGNSGGAPGRSGDVQELAVDELLVRIRSEVARQRQGGR